MDNCPKIIMVVVVGKKKTIVGITIKRISKTLAVPRNTFDLHFGIILKSFHQHSACLAVHLSL